MCGRKLFESRFKGCSVVFLRTPFDCDSSLGRFWKRFAGWWARAGRILDGRRHVVEKKDAGQEMCRALRVGSSKVENVVSVESNMMKLSCRAGKGEQERIEQDGLERTIYRNGS